MMHLKMAQITPKRPNVKYFFFDEYFAGPDLREGKGGNCIGRKNSGGR